MWCPWTLFLAQWNVSVFGDITKWKVVLNIQ